MADEKLTELSPMDRAKRVAKGIYSRISDAPVTGMGARFGPLPNLLLQNPTVVEMGRDAALGPAADVRDLMIAHKTSDPMLAVLAGIGLTGVPAKEVVKVAKETGKSMAQVIKEARSYFDGDVLNLVERGAFPRNPNSRRMMLYMKPQEFLDIALPLKEFEPSKLRALDEAVEKGDKLDQIPHLKINEHGEVMGHEGRHRAKTFIDRGVERMPVDFETEFRVQRQLDPTKSEYVEDLPQSLIREEHNIVDFEPDELFKTMDAPYYTSGPRRGQAKAQYGGEEINPEAREEMTRLLEAGKTKEAARLAAFRADLVKRRADEIAYRKMSPEQKREYNDRLREKEYNYSLEDDMSAEDAEKVFSVPEESPYVPYSVEGMTDYEIIKRRNLQKELERMHRDD